MGNPARSRALNGSMTALGGLARADFSPGERRAPAHAARLSVSTGLDTWAIKRPSSTSLNAVGGRVPRVGLLTAGRPRWCEVPLAFGYMEAADAGLS